MRHSSEQLNGPTQQTPYLSDFLPVRVQVVAFFFQLLLQVFDLLLPPVVLLHHLEIHDNFKRKTSNMWKVYQSFSLSLN